MKTILLLVTLLTFSTISNSQSAVQSGGDSTVSESYFIVLYTTGDKWDSEKEFHEQLYFTEHSKHLGDLRKAKTITLGGRYSDVGLIMIKAKNKAEAKTLITSDISIINGIFKAEIHAFDPFYSGCVE